MFIPVGLSLDLIVAVSSHYCSSRSHFQRSSPSSSAAISIERVNLNKLHVCSRTNLLAEFDYPMIPWIDRLQRRSIEFSIEAASFSDWFHGNVIVASTSSSLGLNTSPCWLTLSFSVFSCKAFYRFSSIDLRCRLLLVSLSQTQLVGIGQPTRALLLLTLVVNGPTRARFSRLAHSLLKFPPASNTEKEKERGKKQTTK